MKTKNTQINIYVSILKDGRIAVAEYMHNQSRNVIEPFKPTNTLAIGRVREMIQRCPHSVKLISKYTTGAADILQKLLDQQIAK